PGTVGFKGGYESHSGNLAGEWKLLANTKTLADSGSALALSHGTPGSQAWYNQAIIVDPRNDNHVFLDLEEVFETNNAGQTWTTTGPYWNFPFSCWDVDPSQNTCPGTVHPDQHALAISGGTLYTANDGGVYSHPMRDVGVVKWRDLNATLATCWSPRTARACGGSADITDRTPMAGATCPGHRGSSGRAVASAGGGARRPWTGVAKASLLGSVTATYPCSMGRQSESGLPVEPVYGPGQPPGFDPAGQLGSPGEFPFTRGIYPGMYTTRPWTIRQYAGFATARESNERYHQLIAAGTTGLSVAFDLPTQMGYDSDAPAAHGEVGKVGVAIDSVADMTALLDRIPLGQVSTSMTINAPAAVLLLLYQLVAEEQGVPAGALSGTIQNDVLKEYIARGTYIYPPEPSLRLVADTFAYCPRELPRWHPISISGYQLAEAGATRAQEIAFTLANGKEYVRAALGAGLAVDDFAPRLSFFFVARTTLLEEVAKFRAARRMWARIMRDEFGAADPRSQMLRFHTQTAGVQLTAQQPEVNLARVTVQALAAVLGGTQSLHTNAYDEAIALPSERAAR